MFYKGYCSLYYSSSGSSSLYCLCGCLCLNFLMASVFDSASIIMIMYRESRLDQYSNSYGFIFYPLISILFSVDKVEVYDRGHFTRSCRDSTKDLESTVYGCYR